MGCGSSRSQESRPTSPQVSPAPTAQLQAAHTAKEEEEEAVDSQSSKEALELQLFQGNSSKGLNSFKALAFAQTKFVQQVGDFWCKLLNIALILKV